MPHSLPDRIVEFPEVDLPLKADVGYLGSLLGEVLVDQAGPELLAQVEKVRKLAIARRENGQQIGPLQAELRNLAPETADVLTRAFTIYFRNVNLAERVHRIRRRFDHLGQNHGPQPGGLHATLLDLKAAGLDLDTVNAAMQQIRLEPVFTAHPTEATRRTLLMKEREIIRALMRRITGDAALRGDVCTAQIRMGLTGTWQTADQPHEKPTIHDELLHVSFYLLEILYRCIPLAFEELERASIAVYGKAIDPPPWLQFGNWVGGDMDGNPNAHADTVLATTTLQRQWILTAYQEEVVELAKLLSQSTNRVSVDLQIAERIATYRVLLPKAGRKLRERHADMPYRQLMSLVAERLEASRSGKLPGYLNPDQFRADLQLVADSLLTHRGKQAGWFPLRRLMTRLSVFGFHLARLDLRQDSSVHARVLAELLVDPSWAERDVAHRTKVLSSALDSKKRLRAAAGEEAEQVVGVFKAMAAQRKRYGAAGFGPYIVSMTRDPADLLAVLALAERAGKGSSAALDVVPLFETIDDLKGAAQIMRALFALPVYQRHLAERGEQQMVMLGYSDSSKDGGLLASRFALQRAQVELLEVAAEAGVAITFFHGRGGSVSRGGSKTERAVMAAPRGAIAGKLRLTEQGEVIHRKYGMRALALRNLEQMASAVLRATLTPRPPEPREPQWRTMMALVARRGEEKFRALVQGEPDFVPYFRTATPIDVIERLKIGSRPSRRGSDGLKSLRAIPWVFAWSQSRSGLSAWYAVGTGLQAGIDEFGLPAMQEMGREWAFFATLLEDVEMVLSKTDLDIAACYSELSGPLHAHFFPIIEAEFALALRAVLAIRGKNALLEDDRRLNMLIRLRNPYVDPLSLIQVDLLKRWRAADRPDDALFHALVGTINGISQGLQNTG